ncbi:2,4-dienoyl-CoA reductase-like NADH-dependent reductase (Old Yellow Enzyme family) [Lutibacter sp. Hel_I_33_5]|uniref:NADH:flavin oxidoreductase/NADH oxidase family protein n=1 Tax=Lutibacter sp. Hel_I_33_5 TaxID=1566289 RepID=UPI0011A6344E|nr:NADH:flavin oxidoreductase/NADH oxidase family protein [Lutibacter sp. Hel_I_33_5]TVZ54912.1 2,4-dienoyl-CoA reductase-like NADH-dependent reductase (Old Yellow Enzyme family) [Lutibacter sp. Hel_I_33_5]
MKSAKKLQQSFTLPCGVTIPNRIVKSAMSENNADKGGKPSERILKLYKTWGEGGTGILISGNVMMDSKALNEPRNVVVEDVTYMTELKEWAAVSQKHGSHLWMQINHPGRQSPKFNKDVVSASDVQLPIKSMFPKPRPMTEDEIWKCIDGFGDCALTAKKAGFKGVQIHGAHGYLVSQFLSTLTNLRTDTWGGSLENRARFALEIYRNMRKKVGPGFPIGIKINSADFQRGAFTEEESLEVIEMLSAEGIDMIEVSGGTYEKAAMMGAGKKIKESTKKREAYFAEFIVKARAKTKVPLLLTGGFRTLDIMEKAIENNELDFVGLARPFAVFPHLSKEFFEGSRTEAHIPPVKTGLKFIDKMGFLDISYFSQQMKRMGKGEVPNPKLSVWSVFFNFIKETVF